MKGLKNAFFQALFVMSFWQTQTYSDGAMEQELSFQKGLLKKKTKTKTKTKNEKDPTCAIFLESRGRKDIKHDVF